MKLTKIISLACGIAFSVFLLSGCDDSDLAENKLEETDSAKVKDKKEECEGCVEFLPEYNGYEFKSHDIYKDLDNVQLMVNWVLSSSYDPNSAQEIIDRNFVSCNNVTRNTIVEILGRAGMVNTAKGHVEYTKVRVRSGNQKGCVGVTKTINLK